VLFAEKFKPCLRDHRLSRGIKPIHLGIWGDGSRGQIQEEEEEEKTLNSEREGRKDVV